MPSEPVATEEHRDLAVQADRGVSSVLRVDRAWWIVGAAVFAVAFLVRLVPVLRGGGLTGLGNYDDAVHFAAAVGLVHAQVPYADFLLLQPPGIVVLLVPFAGLGEMIGDPSAWAIARLTWMVLGALTAVVISRLLRPQGLVAAITGGLVYALFFPVAYVERTTILEGPQNFLLAVALLLLVRTHPSVSSQPERADRPAASPGPLTRRVWLAPLLAGVALGYSVGIKIWAVAGLVVILVWLALTRRLRDLVWTVIGAAACTGLVYGVFFVQAPAAMWQMVVTDQLGRRRTDSTVTRLLFQTGLSPYGLGQQLGPELIILLLALLVAAVLAWRVATMRVVIALYVIFTVVLVSTPSAFLHYGALSGTPTAVLVGSGAGQAIALLRQAPWPAWGRRIGIGVLTLGLVAVGLGMAYAQTRTRFGTTFPRAELTRAIAGVKGCVVYDDPGTVLLLDRLRRDLDQGCEFVVDLGGRSYHPPMITDRSRQFNTLWQDYAVDYLRTGEVAIIYRFRSGFGFSKPTARTVLGWPRVIKSGKITVVRPQR